MHFQHEWKILYVRAGPQGRTRVLLNTGNGDQPRRSSIVARSARSAAWANIELTSPHCKKVKESHSHLLV